MADIRLMMFYPVTGDNDRYEYDMDGREVLEKVKDDDSVRIYDIDNNSRFFMNMLDFEDNYNDELLDGGYWMTLITVSENDFKEIFNIE